LGVDGFLGVLRLFSGEGVHRFMSHRIAAVFETGKARDSSDEKQAPDAINSF
jgi:hypothetical protein